MKRFSWLVGGLGLALFMALVVLPATLSADTLLDLNSPDPYWTEGDVAHLQVSIDPSVVGGYANLYVEGEDNIPHPVMTFALQAPMFQVDAPVPMATNVPGDEITYYYEAFAPDGTYIGESKKKKGPRHTKPPVEWF